MLKDYVNRLVASSLRRPNASVVGWLMAALMESRNSYLEKAAVRLSRLEPHHHVLELGFGPGVGLSSACKLVTEGKVHGVDHSKYMVNRTSGRLRSHIRTGKLELHEATVMHLPFLDNSFDRVFHCNCFYFWPDFVTVAKEVHRVTKDDGLMVTTLNIEDMQESKNRGHLPGTNTNVLNYMVALELAGFKNVYIEYIQYKDTSYQAIYADVVKTKEKPV